MPGHRKRRQFKQTDAFTRGMVIGLKRAGWSIRQIAADTHLGASTVHRLWRRWLEHGNVAIYRNVGATRVMSARVDRRILRQAVAAPQATCTAILQHVQDTLDHSISTRTISRRLVANGLHSCRPLRRLPLTPPNRRQRLEWCRARSTWMTEWHRVVFSDESRFCLSSDSRRVRVWRRRGERSNPAAIVERPTVRQRGIMVWGTIAYDSRSPLLRIQGTMTAQRYVDDVLRPVTLPYLQGVPNALYQQYNARPHTARISQQALQDVQMLPWPPYSPDLSPIEHVWDIIGRRLHALPQPRSEDELWQMVEREWRAIPQDAIRTLIDSLPRRVAACIVVREFKVKKSQKSRTLLRSSATKSIKEIVAELDKESPSRETIRINFKVLETNENQLRDVYSQIMNLMLENETITPHDLEKEPDMVLKENEHQGRSNLDPTRSVQEGLSEVQYLVQSMRAGTRADRLVRSYPLTTENYPKVVKTLQNRFGDKVTLVDVYVRHLLKLVINNARKKTLTLESLYDQVESHLRALESLGVTTQQNASFLYPLVESSLPEDLLRIWQRSALAGYSEDEGELPISIAQRLQRLLEFLRREDCAGWRSMTVTKRMDEMRKVDAYFPCLRVGHMRATCRTQIRCSHCRGPHHTALDLPRQELRASTGEQEFALSEMHVRTAIPKALLATARVRIVGPQGVRITVRALLDQESQSSFAHQDLHHLTVPVHKVNAQIYGINDTRGEHVKQMALVVGRMTGILPSRDLRIPMPSSWKALPLADPQFETSVRVDVILGADVYGSLLLPEFKYDKGTQLCAQKTRLGWIISGKLPTEGEGSPHMVYNIQVNYEENLDNILRRFWEVEKVPIRPAKSSEDEFCEELYKTKVKIKTSSGRYIVTLPFDPKVPVPELFGGSVSICVQRQLSLERGMAKQVPLKEEYHSFMREYIKLGHMTPLPELVAEDSPGGCFIPHHAVWGNQQKLRVVFDASTVTSNGFSFNNRLYTGPKLQRNIFVILMNWRHYKVVMLVDIEKMYRQLLVCPTDAARQKILWRETSNEPMIPYRLNTVMSLHKEMKLLSVACYRWWKTVRSHGMVGARYCDRKDYDSAVVGSWERLGCTDRRTYKRIVEEVSRTTGMSSNSSDTPLVGLNGNPGHPAAWMQRCLRRCTDATIALAWIKTIARTLPTFVGNRDEQGLLRVGGELRWAPGIPYHHRYPALLPSEGRLSQLIIRDRHQITLHGGTTVLTYEDMLTVLIHIESCLNSRPLAPLGNDLNDLEALNPAHFSITSTSQCVPEEEFILVKDHLLWSTDFIQSLQQRNKWKIKEPNMLAGSLVLIKEGHVLPAKWLMGRVVEVHPGKDGVVRVVSVRTMAGVIKRPLVKLALLQGPPVSFDGAHQLGEDVQIDI
ncbi:hypothetical protein LAZ67_8000946 [Cordylochernes scorpioides]|uniref:Uncharacterized protein n=1 Tax=Cordylochernes scorpioides TaxID=51811 RepID=A0ABY6KRR9_9ARAC|nr:hypothetical protein LAZ67_8000946 [Cordylochernes scorpioides]